MVSYGLQATYSHEAQATMIITSHTRELDMRHPGTRSPRGPAIVFRDHVPPRGTVT